MIKTIFFDFDGVLTTDKNDGYTICKYVASKTGLTFDQLYAAYSPYLQRLYAGKVTNEHIWPEFVVAAGKPIDLALLYESFDATPRNEAMLTLAKQLKSLGYNVGVITNQTVARYERLRKPFELDTVFDPVVVSAAVGVTKAGEFGGEKIFELALSEHSDHPEEAVFIDNTEANLDIPQRMGMHTVYHDDAKNDMPALRRALSALGVKLA